MNEAPNSYYVYLHQGQEPVAWKPPDPHPLDWVNYTYFGKVFEAVEKKLKVRGLVFYLTWDSVNELPSYGKNVVAVVVGDEWCRIPTYYDKVLAVFKCYGIEPILGCNPFIKPSYLNLLTLIHFCKTKFHHLSGWLNHVFHNLKDLPNNSKPETHIYDIPLGYDRQLDLTIKSLDKRKYDIFFAGSIEHGNHPLWSLKYWFDNPKSISRKNMISSLGKLIAKHPSVKVDLVITSSFGFSKDALDESSYSRQMMDSRICLVPRGTSFETFRFFEAIRYGCIVIGETLPQRWFYDGSPAIKIDDWDELERILPRLLEEKNLMREKHQQALNWWQTKCSEIVVGEYIAEKINLLASLS